MIAGNSSSTTNVISSSTKRRSNGSNNCSSVLLLQACREGLAPHEDSRRKEGTSVRGKLDDLRLRAHFAAQGAFVWLSSLKHQGHDAVQRF